MTEKKVAVENKVAETKVAFDRKAFFTKIQKAFSKNTMVDVVADTDREESINCSEYEYIHFYKKGTERNLFQLYVKEKDCKFVVGMTLKDFVKQGNNYTITPIEKKNKDGEKKVTCIVVSCAHEDAELVAETIITAYESKKITEVVEVPEKKDTKTKEAKTSTKKAAKKKEA